MDFKEAMDEVSEGKTVKVTPKNAKSHTYELAVRYCAELDDELLMCRYVSKDGNRNDWEPVVYLFCNEDVIDGDWEIVSNRSE